MAEKYAIWAHKEAVETWNEPKHQEGIYSDLIGDELCRRAFEAGYEAGKE